jgi:hypothetical protein
MVPIPVWCFVMGAMSFIVACNSKSFWAIVGFAISGAFLWFLALKEWRYQNGKPSARKRYPRRRRFSCQYCGCLGFHREVCPAKGRRKA